MSGAEASSESAPRVLAWRAGIGIFAGAAVMFVVFGVVAAVRGFWLGTAICAFGGLFEAWRARTVYRRKPGARHVDAAIEHTERNARMRRSAWLITGCAVGCAALAPFGGRVGLWLIASLLAAGAAFAWFTALWLIPRATRSQNASGDA